MIALAEDQPCLLTVAAGNPPGGAEREADLAVVGDPAGGVEPPVLHTSIPPAATVVVGVDVERLCRR